MGHLIVWNLSGWSVYNISGKIRVFAFADGDNKTNETDNEQISERMWRRRRKRRNKFEQSIGNGWQTQNVLPKKNNSRRPPPSAKYQKLQIKQLILPPKSSNRLQCNNNVILEGNMHFDHPNISPNDPTVLLSPKH